MMNRRRRLFSAILSSALILVPLAAFSGDQPLSLKHGLYMRGRLCKGAPNAEILAWDGSGFSGAHSSQCTSQAQHQNGARYQIKTTCLKLGDGTPNPSGSPSEDSFVLNRISSTHFQVSKENLPAANFRWCSAGTTPQ
jgi:hypothetical protein